MRRRAIISAIVYTPPRDGLSIHGRPGGDVVSGWYSHGWYQSWPPFSAQGATGFASALPAMPLQDQLQHFGVQEPDIKSTLA
jgi:hypothetical protein